MLLLVTLGPNHLVKYTFCRKTCRGTKGRPDLAFLMFRDRQLTLTKF
jgi:hypothetical protein